MQYRYTLLSALVALAVFSCSRDPARQTESATATAAPSSEWVDLLDADLTEWEMYNGDALRGWEFRDGELHASGAGWDADQDLITREEYDNFELALEWKVEPGNSSGIFYHAQRDPATPIYEAAPEYQVMDDEGWSDPLEPNQRTAGNYAMHAPEGAEPRPAGEWNSTRIVVNHPRVEHWLNGTKVVEYKLGSDDWKQRKAAGKWADVADYGVATSGHIGLQNAGKVVYRNIKIKEL
ncbi:hypothetical protein GGR28_001810 [Lewinella aquimaris]|uniref:3-keto-alpha-glucoside-1,2-lyase/3-keto-2-hydroxy-glucal hydratase domain-containing protein n=1 Tax=Neolewinella aquimaris TaxID=1835722 RepID=A0A840E269_9BACT|nr:DUF1080 domain-containing protein [Neolewinella aquimaris]MBB4079190.1 hypothetical protein [Neolewinella aquimaris]